MICEYQRDLREIVLADKAEEELERGLKREIEKRLKAQGEGRRARKEVRNRAMRGREEEKERREVMR
ncbi:MAG: hypothetical protein U9N53_14185 [Bacteroidota bacterium]|nr:hypothetical protein [Bacteroidota bacterium]